MVTLKDLETRVPNMIKRLEDAIFEVSKYKKSIQTTGQDSL